MTSGTTRARTARSRPAQTAPASAGTLKTIVISAVTTVVLIAAWEVAQSLFLSDAYWTRVRIHDAGTDLTGNRKILSWTGK